jgi:imidazolonepropionase-like amidohydrolase
LNSVVCRSFIFVAFAVAFSLGCVAPEAPEVRSRSTAIAFVDVEVVPLDSERVLSDQTVIVDGDRIVAIGPAAKTPAPRGARIIDGRGKYLMPGLMDMHVHLASEADLDLFVARGVTTVRNMWGTPMHLVLRERVAKGEIVGPTIVTAGPILDGDPPAHDGSLVVKTEDDADRAVAMHKELGYDFVKVYSRLSAPVYRRIFADARAAGLKVAGHVPREVGLEGVIAAHQDAVEHLTGFIDAFQRSDSPAIGKFDRANMALKIDFVDEAKIPIVAGEIAAANVWQCPTLTVVTNKTPDELRRRLKAPEMRYIAPLQRAIWTPGREPAADVLARDARENGIHDKTLRALHAAGARILVGTDTGNPWVVPGFATHQELASLVQAGFTPYEVLRAATHESAVFLGQDTRVGTLTVGRLADLILVDGNPLRAVQNAEHIEGVMTRGRWFDQRALDGLLDKAAAAARGDVDPFAGLPPLAPEGKRVFVATFETSWKDARFGVESIAVGAKQDGQVAIAARAFDAQAGQRATLQVEADAAGSATRLFLESEGAKGRGRVEIIRNASKASLRGTLLSGPTFQREDDVGVDAVFGVQDLVAGKVLLAKRIGGLAIGQSIDVSLRELALGSHAELAAKPVKVTRTPDVELPFQGKATPAHRFEISPGKGPKETLWLDADGFPLRYEFDGWGATVILQRRD